MAAIKSLDGNSDNTKIKYCHDLDLTYSKWQKVYSSWLQDLKPEPWNQTTHAIDCMTIEKLNIFTRKCNDLPDWRLPESRTRDDKRLAEFRKMISKN
ncbi:MAG: hypothetical protein OQK35_03180 [Alphaproteobacteria bacterium]|nr:hypothetical protein [Rhodospirillales bacterium]MCW9045314.1 hypothetical protein [Alphaproteobacteria bacterium]